LRRRVAAAAAAATGVAGVVAAFQEWPLMSSVSSLTPGEK